MAFPSHLDSRLQSASDCIIQWRSANHSRTNYSGLSYLSDTNSSTALRNFSSCFRFFRVSSLNDLVSETHIKAIIIENGNAVTIEAVCNAFSP